MTSLTLLLLSALHFSTTLFLQIKLYFQLHFQPCHSYYNGMKSYFIVPLWNSEWTRTLISTQELCNLVKVKTELILNNPSLMEKIAEHLGKWYAYQVEGEKQCYSRVLKKQTMNAVCITNEKIQDGEEDFATLSPWTLGEGICRAAQMHSSLLPTIRCFLEMAFKGLWFFDLLVTPSQELTCKLNYSQRNWKFRKSQCVLQCLSQLEYKITGLEGAEGHASKCFQTLRTLQIFFFFFWLNVLGFFFTYF